MSHLAQCQNKMVFASRADAKGYARFAASADGRKLNPYTCGVCGRWHLTSLPKRLARAKGYTG